MKINEDQYNEKRYRTAYRTTVFSITAVLFMLGLTVMILFFANNFSAYIRENIAVAVEIDENISEEIILKFRDSIINHPAVKSVNYVSPEEASQILRNELGDDFLAFIGYNPIPPTFEVFLHEAYTFSDAFKNVEDFLNSKKIVTSVFYEKDILNKVNQNLSRITLGILLFSAILLIVSILLINNTIRLAVYSKRQLIRSMYLVGATRGFIRRPFLIGGILQGLSAGIVSSFLLMMLLVVISRKLPELYLFENSMILIMILAAIIVFGIFISWFSNYIAVKKYLR
jgi:cell division transport system permease protein